MDYGTNNAGYFIVLSLEGCSGCTAFKQNMEPALLKILPQSMGYVRIDVPKNGKTPSEYSKLFSLRDSGSYPAIAWSPYHPKNIYSSGDIHWFKIDRSFTLSQMVAWLKNVTPADMWEQTSPPVVPSSSGNFMTPSSSLAVPKTTSTPAASSSKPYSPSKTAGAVFGSTNPSAKYGFYGY